MGRLQSTRSPDPMSLLSQNHIACLVLDRVTICIQVVNWWSISEGLCLKLPLAQVHLVWRMNIPCMNQLHIYSLSPLFLSAADLSA